MNATATTENETITCRRCGRTLTDEWAKTVGIGAWCCRKLAGSDRDRIATAIAGLQLEFDWNGERRES